MLETLHIENYALIDKLEVDFRPGFNVLTGETGAGKSIIVEALGLVLGARASGDAVREGGGRARVDAVFRLAKPSRRLKRLLEEADIALDGDELILSRTVGAEGRSRAYVCGTLVALNVLSDIGDELVDMHGQHEHQSLVKPDRQLDLLDTWAEAESEAEAVSSLVGRLRSIEKAIAELETDDRERTRRLEFLRFEVDEINSAALEPGEEEECKGRRNLMANAERIRELAGRAYAGLYESDGAAVDAIDAALHDIQALSAIDVRFAALAQQLEAARTQAREVAHEVLALGGDIEFDAEELERINQRIAVIGGLKRKFGDSIEAILAYRDTAQAEIERFDRRDQNLEALRNERAGLAREAQAAADALSRKRRAAARQLDKKVSASIQELGMQGGRIETAFEAVELNSRGIDKVECLLTANPGERPKPLRQVASGGEISRVMLALKSVFARADRIPTLVFDEIDAGVGGSIASKVAGRLRDLAQTHQLLCISHLPQIAAAASAHLCVAKGVKKGRTITWLDRLEAEARVAEVARLLDGSASAVSLEHARALLATSEEAPRNALGL